jgi:YesN/AraC family two-component response regulator
MSPKEPISKVLTLHFSTTFKEYLYYLRISEAKELLKNSNLNVSEIAYSVGYKNVTHFNRVFKTKEKNPPNESINN